MTKGEKIFTLLMIFYLILSGGCYIKWDFLGVVIFGFIYIGIIILFLIIKLIKLWQQQNKI